jgi:6-phosphogluconolactonase (cycloisomerase 2 family)
LQYLQTLRNEQNGIAKLVSPHALATSADSNFLYVACNQSVVVFQKHDGQYHYLQTMSNSDLKVSGLRGAASIALSAYEKYVFVASEIDGALVTLTRSKNGLLHFNSVLREPELEGASSVTLSNHGKYLFVTAGNEGNSLSTYEIIPSN